MNRNITNLLRFILDELLPPILRDNKYFMYPLFWIWYKGKHVKRRMEFKTAYHELTPETYADFYALKDSLSHDRPTDLNKESIEYIIKNIGDNKSTKVLDVGCGRGYFLNRLQEKEYDNIYGLDLFDNLDLGKATYVKGNIENLPFKDNEFDVITCSHTIEHLLDPQKSISELKRVAKKVIITVPKQRYYHYTFDLHIHFFPEKSYLISMIGMDSYTCAEQNGDWVFVGMS